jgi:hypothetical protein
MIYVKSFFAGLFAVLVAALIGVLVLAVRFRPTASGTPGWDPLALFRLPLVWIVTLAIFLLGSYWEFRRLAR